MRRVKVGSDYIIEIPEDVRNQLGIVPGDVLRVELRDNAMVLTHEPRDPVERMRGLHKEVWEGVDVEKYINELRGEWDE
jgi:AbrB family looped-hinge helix DNA binding protein